MTIHIAYAADANYGPYAGISLSSVLNHNRWNQLHFHILSDGIRTRDLNRFHLMAGRSSQQVQVSVYDVTKHLESLPIINRPPNTLKYTTRTGYARLWLAQILPTTVNHLLYLDCDTVCIAKLNKLWDMRDSTKSALAMRDDFSAAHRDYKTRTLRMPIDAPYYNSGVMLINLAHWRAQRYSDSFRDFLLSMSEPPKTLDQDIINAVLWREIQSLDPCWNTCFLADANISNARILHFAGKFKPWQLGYRGPGADQYRAAKRASPWLHMLPDFGIRRAGRRIKSSIAKRRA